MNKRAAFYSNDFFLTNEHGDIIGHEYDGEKIMLRDRVRIQDDGCGYIAPGITHEGYGTIVDFVDNYTDHYFGVRMDNGEYGHVKRARIAEVFPKAATA